MPNASEPSFLQHPKSFSKLVQASTWCKSGNQKQHLCLQQLSSRSWLLLEACKVYLVRVLLVQSNASGKTLKYFKAHATVSIASWVTEVVLICYQGTRISTRHLTGNDHAFTCFHWLGCFTVWGSVSLFADSNLKVLTFGTHRSVFLRAFRCEDEDRKN